MEKKIWCPYEDNILFHLREERKLQKWTDIARALSDEYNIKGLNGKLCKQRFQERFDFKDQNSNWPFQEEKVLFALHNQLGNKWAIISRKMKGKSDNCIKNHFYSRLRKGLKNMNLMAEQKLGKMFKQIKFTVLFKIIEASEDFFKHNHFCQEDTSKFCYELKNNLIALSYDNDEEHDFHPELIDGVQIYHNINEFSRTYKRKPKKFRRIPTKTLDRQNETFSEEFSYDEKLQEELIRNKTDDTSNFETHAVSRNSERQDQNLYLPQLEAINEEARSQLYQSKNSKSSKKRRQSAQTVGIQEILRESGMLLSEPMLPLLSLNKKRTSYLQYLDEQPQKSNQFFDQIGLEDENFYLKQLGSMKRMSQSDLFHFD